MTAALGLPPDPSTSVRASAPQPVRSWAPRKLEGPEALPAPGDGSTTEATSTGRASGDFGELVADAVRSVDAQAKDAGRRAQDLAAGRSYDVHGTMIALEEAGIATRLLANVRNRAIEAYREIMRMGA